MTRTAQASSPGLMWTLAGSLAVHAAVVGIMFGVMSFAPRLAAPPQTVLITKLVRLGTPRPKELLPHKDEPPPPPPPPPIPAVLPQAPAVVAPPPPVKPAPQVPPAPGPSAAAAPTAPSARERINALNQTRRALDRLKHVVDGEADGAVDGDSDVRLMGDRYMSLVYKCIKDHYVVEGADAAKVANLTATLLVRVQPDGTVSAHLERGSGVTAFDQATTRAVQRCGRVEPPPVPLRDTVRRDGIEIVFQP